MASRRSTRQPAPSTAQARGLFVVLAAILVGVVILANMSSTPGRSVASTAATTTTTTRSLPTITTPVAAAHTPASVNVLVLNGVDPKRAIAKPAATTIAGAGFTTLAPRDAATTVAKSVVYFVAEYQPDAATIAAVLSIPPVAVIPLPTPTPVEVGDPATAQVIVVIGPDAPAAG